MVSKEPVKAKARYLVQRLHRKHEPPLKGSAMRQLLEGGKPVEPSCTLPVFWHKVRSRLAWTPLPEMQNMVYTTGKLIFLLINLCA